MSTRSTLILATNPDKISFSLGECTGGGPADGMEVLILVIEGWTDEETGKVHPEKKIVFSRHTCKAGIIAMATYLARDDVDRNEGPALEEIDDS